MADEAKHYFHPHVGAKAAEGFRGGVRLLLVGDSHYGNLDETGTQFVVKTYIDDGEESDAYRFLSRVQHIVTGKAPVTRDDRAEFLDRVSFTNLIQEPLPSANTVPTTEQWRAAWSVFASIIRATEPDMAFFFTKRGWGAEQLYGQETPGENLAHLYPEGRRGDTAYLRFFPDIRPDYRVLTAAFNHPSRRFEPDRWCPWADRLLTEAVAMKNDPSWPRQAATEA